MYDNVICVFRRMKNNVYTYTYVNLYVYIYITAPGAEKFMRVTNETVQLEASPITTVCFFILCLTLRKAKKNMGPNKTAQREKKKDNRPKLQVTKALSIQKLSL